jgi:hypothetical protein
MAVLLKFAASDDEAILDRNLEGNRSAGLERHVRRALGLDLLFSHEYVQLRGFSQIRKTLGLGVSCRSAAWDEEYQAEQRNTFGAYC